MAKDPSFPFYAQDYLVDTLRWSRDMKSLHIDLLCESWANGSIMDDNGHPFGLGSNDVEIWLKIKYKWVEKNGIWINEKLEEVRSARQEFKKIQSEKGKKSAEKRKNLTIVNNTIQPKSNNGSTVVQPFESESEYEYESEYSLEKDSKKKPLKKSNQKNAGLAKTDHGRDFQKIIDLGFKESLDLAQEIDQVWLVWLAYKKSELNFTYKTPASNNVGKMELYDYSQGNLTQAKQIVLRSIGKKWKGLVRPEQPEQKTETLKIVNTVDEACKIASQIRQNQTA